MKNKNMPHTMTRANAITVSLICLCIGFVLGVAYTSYHLDSSNQQVAKADPATNEYEQKILSLRARLATDPKNVSAWVQLGNAYFDTDQFQEAIRSYETSLELNPSDANVLTDLGVMYRRNRQPEKAVAAFDRAIAVDGRHETALLNKGIVLLHDLNQKQAAIKVWEELLAINPIAMAGENQSLDQMIQHYKQK